MALTMARRRWVGVVMLAGACAVATATNSFARAQMPIGSVSTLDASVSGQSFIANDRAQLGTNGTVIAKEHGAFVQLLRGGSVRVCATSGVHLTAGTPATAIPVAAEAAPGTTASTASSASGAATNPGTAADTGTVAAPGVPGALVTDSSAAAPLAASTDAAVPAANSTVAWAANLPPPLMVALDRGAMELHMGAVTGDIVMTPDLRFSFTGEGQLDVRIRVGRNGDTCVENRVSGLGGHPGLNVGSLFGSETYNVLPGQHVLFEGGSLREVVDNESSPCGCPEEAVKPPPSNADLSLKKGAKVTSTQAAVQHPFPADVSQGLAPPPEVPQALPQVTHTQVATTLVYNGGGTFNETGKKGDSATPASPAQKKGFFHSIGRFFKRVFY